MVKINGNKLGWSIIHLCFFASMIFADIEIDPTEYGLIFWFMAITYFFGWRFLENMKVAIK